jgi:nucleotide-binding universal stress UspA family protein
MKLLKTILHPTEFSDLSRTALQTAVALAQEHEARLILMHVQEPQEVIEGEFGMLPPEPEPDDQQVLDALRGLLPPDLSIPVEYRVAHGNVAEEIVQTAEANQCDLIVLAKHGRRNFFTRWLHANVAEQVMQSAPCKVMAFGSSPSARQQPAYLS